MSILPLTVHLSRYGCLWCLCAVNCVHSSVCRYSCLRSVYADNIVYCSDVEIAVYLFTVRLVGIVAYCSFVAVLLYTVHCSMSVRLLIVIKFRTFVHC